MPHEQRYSAKKAVAETSKLMRCECGLYDSEWGGGMGKQYMRTLDGWRREGTWTPKRLCPYCVIERWSLPTRR